MYLREEASNKVISFHGIHVNNVSKNKNKKGIQILGNGARLMLGDGRIS